MDDDKFRFTKTNIIMILITFGSLIVLGVSILFLTKSFSDPVNPLPDLDITEGRTSTKQPRETTTAETTTTTTTTAAPTSSPYYRINPEDYISEELVKNMQLTKTEKLELAKQYFDFFMALYNTSDYTIFNTEAVLNNAKPGEKDVIEYKGHKYAEIYNGNEIMKKYFTGNQRALFSGVTYDKIEIFTFQDDKLYRVENITSTAHPVFSTIELTKSTALTLNFEIRYYMSNYKEEGLTAPVYKNASIVLKVKDDRWLIERFKYPSYA